MPEPISNWSFPTSNTLVIFSPVCPDGKFIELSIPRANKFLPWLIFLSTLLLFPTNKTFSEFFTVEVLPRTITSFEVVIVFPAPLITTALPE